MMRALLLGGVVALGFGQAAYADVIFNLSNVNFTTTVNGSTPAGTLTGSFTTNNALSTVTDFDIVASSVPGTFAGFNYIPTNSIVMLTVSSQSIVFTAFTARLNLAFDAPLTASGATVSSSIFSFESELVGGYRSPNGSIVAATSPISAVPEPATLALLGMGVGVAGLVVGRRRRAA